MRRMAGLLFAGGLAANLGGNDHTPLVAASCQGFGNAAEILELG
jgi:hypothetical protein